MLNLITAANCSWEKRTACTVGSGLAGVTAVRVIRGYRDVTVFEHGDKDVATGGHGIALSPHANTILQGLGFDGQRSSIVPSSGS
jgi:predicted NAD/FAD-binding protein